MDELLRGARHARLFLFSAVALGILGAAATIAQMTFLSEVVGAAFVDGTRLDGVREPLLFLLAAGILRAGLLWAREIVAGRGAVAVKSVIRDRLFCAVPGCGGVAFSPSEKEALWHSFCTAAPPRRPAPGRSSGTPRSR